MHSERLFSTRFQRKALDSKLRPFELRSNRTAAFQILGTSFLYLASLVLTLALFEHAWWAGWIGILPSGLLLTRLFVLQHDCGHGSLFASQRTNDWVGGLLGILTLTPILNWRYVHNLHHASSGNLDERNSGDIWLMTVEEYQQSAAFTRWKYRTYRTPVFLFFLGPAFYFIFRRRFGVKLLRHMKKEKRNVFWTNVAIGIFYSELVFIFGFTALLKALFPIAAVGASLGVWLFYVQHTFEDAYFQRRSTWKFDDAGLVGSSFYRLPGWLNWFSADIAYHHIHHFNSRIPNYNLRASHEALPELTPNVSLTIRESLFSARLKLWDESKQKFVTEYPR